MCKDTSSAPKGLYTLPYVLVERLIRSISSSWVYCTLTKLRGHSLMGLCIQGLLLYHGVESLIKSWGKLHAWLRNYILRTYGFAGCSVLPRLQMLLRNALWILHPLEKLR